MQNCADGEVVPEGQSRINDIRGTPELVPTQAPEGRARTVRPLRSTDKHSNSMPPGVGLCT